MADIQMSGAPAGYGGHSGLQGASASSQLKSGVSAATLANIAGAVVSLALVVGVGIWGYQLLMRDVTGVPVVRAAEGPMRVAPEDPGGRQADHQGLAVNEVAGRGTASGPVDQVALAPRGVGLETEDVPGQTNQRSATHSAVQTANPPLSGNAAQTNEVIATEATLVVEGTDPARPAEAPSRRIMTNRVTGTVPDVATGQSDTAMNNATIQALADQIAAGSAVLSESGSANTPPVETNVKTAALAPVIDAPGVARSLRPKLRPGGLKKAAARAPSAAPQATRGTTEVDASSLPAGTRLVQLGAYESAEIARSEWTRISGKFDTFFDEKKRVIQKAQSGGRTFYRLRAHGFADLGEARRFCAALVAERADCIPVVTK